MVLIAGTQCFRRSGYLAGSNGQSLPQLVPISDAFADELLLAFVPDVLACGCNLGVSRANGAVVEGERTLAYQIEVALSIRTAELCPQSSPGPTFTSTGALSANFTV